MTTKNIIFFMFLIFSNITMAMTKLENCLATARGMNSSLPKQIDGITKLVATSCIEDKGEIYFQFVHVISNSSSLPKDIQNKAKASAIQQFCKNTEFRNALNLYNFDFYYTDINRSPLWSFTLTKNNC